MDFQRSFVRAFCLSSAVFWSGIAGAASAPCVDNASLEKSLLGPGSARHFYLECTAIVDNNHPFMARLPAERRAVAAERLRDRAVQTLACSARPRDPARSGLQKKDSVALANCKPPRVTEVWPLP